VIGRGKVIRTLLFASLDILYGIFIHPDSGKDRFSRSCFV